MYIIFIYLLYYWITLKYFNLYFKKRLLSLLRKCIILTLNIFLHLFFLSHFQISLVLFCSNLLITIGLCIALYSAPVKKCLLLCSLGCCLSLLIEILTAIILKLFGASPAATYLASALITKLILLFLVYVLSAYKNRRHYFDIPTRYFCLLITITLSCIIIGHSAFIIYNASRSYKVYFLCLLIIVILLILNISYYIIEDWLCYSVALMSKNLLLSKEIKYYKHIIHFVKIRNKNFSRERHQLKNQLLAIRSYAIQNNNVQIIKYINTILSDPKYGFASEIITFCDNLVLNTLFYSKILLARENAIKYNLDISVPPSLPFDDLDLTNLIGAALDYSFDFCLQNPILKPNISITIKYRSNCLFCYFTVSHADNGIPSSNKTLCKSPKIYCKNLNNIAMIKKIVLYYEGTFHSKRQIITR